MREMTMTEHLPVQSHHRCKWITVALGAALPFLATLEAEAAYRVNLDGRTSTSISNNGVCNLTEAIASANAGRNVSDCPDNGEGPFPPEGQTIQLEAGPGTPPAYELASGTTITTAVPVYINTPSEYPAVVQSAGTVLTVNAGATVSIVDLVIKHKSGSTGRALYNKGTFNAYFSTFQDGNVSGLTCDGSSTAGCGGGILNTGELYLGYSTVQNSRATRGGGVYNGRNNVSAWLRMQQSTVKNNRATHGGGVYNELGSSPRGMELYTSTFSGNWATGNGGGWWTRERVLGHNLTISGNRAGCADLTSCSSYNATGNGGGIYRSTVEGRYLEIKFSTVAFNHAANGGGYYLTGVSSAGMAAYCIFANNVAHVSTNRAHDIFGNPHNEVTQPKGCMITSQGGMTGDVSGDFFENPALRSLTANPGWGSAYHPLPSTSRAIDRAPTDAAGLVEKQDQRAFTRPASPGTGSDIGSFEYQPGWDPP